MIKKIDVDDVYAWLDEEGNFHLKAIDRHGDPVELTRKQLCDLIAGLEALRDAMDP